MKNTKYDKVRRLNPTGIREMTVVAAGDYVAFRDYKELLNDYKLAKRKNKRAGKLVAKLRMKFRDNGSPL